jgi:hypothetical protein
MMPNEISKDQWADWKQHPCTQVFFSIVNSKREEYIQFLSQGGFSNSISKQNLALGSINAYTHMMNVEFVEE